MARLPRRFFSRKEQPDSGEVKECMSFGVTGIDGNITGDGTLSRWYATPHLGWMWILDSGLTLGIELGVQVPFSTDLTIAGLSNRTTARIKNELSPWTSHVLPYLNLIKVGYTF